MAHPGVREGQHGSSGGADRAAWLMPRMRRFTQLNLELSDLPSSHPAVCSYSFLHFLHSLPSYTADLRYPRERLDYMGVLPSYTPYTSYLPTLPTERRRWWRPRRGEGIDGGVVVGVGLRPR
jgi:hypothetical protein